MHSSYSSSDEESDYDEELAIEAKRALVYLQTHRNYRYIEFLAQGGYGWVALVYDDDKRRSLAIKCTNNTTEMELSWWPKLQHTNILPLLEHITLDNCTIFIMPAMRKDLWEVINESHFYEEELSFGLCRVWLRDVASALTYLHSQFLCHLDLKLDNVFLKEDGFACLGDFSLLTDMREVPSGFHFLEVYEPPEYIEWCHGTPPGAMASSMKFGGDKADMWQYGTMTIDLLTDLKLSGSKSSRFSLFHHDVWPFIQKILLHKDYLTYLLEKTFCNVVLRKEDIDLCYQFITDILVLEPDSRMPAESARQHGFTNVKWPQLPEEFTLPKIAVDPLPEPKPMPIEGISDPSLTVEGVMAEVNASDEGVSRTPSIGAFDVMKRKVRAMQEEKIVRRESIAMEAGKISLEIKQAPSIKGLPRKPTPVSEFSSEAESSSSGSDERDDPKQESDVDEVKTMTKFIKTPTGERKAVKVTAIRKKSAKKKMAEA